jgi:choline dehydrogenase
MEWDYIIVGAGSAGCALAWPLVQAGRSVLLLEAGRSDRSAFIKVPAAVWRIRPQHDWGYHAVPDPTRHDAVDHWHRGRVLGGTSSINGMLYVRGATEDYDRWDQLCAGQGGWSAQALQPVFQAIESSDQPGTTRGHAGPLHIRTVQRRHAITDAFIRAAGAAGHLFNEDYNGSRQEGVAYLQFTQRRGFRWSAADAFVRPLLAKPNFRLRLDTLVDRIEMKNGRAQAVLFRHAGRACREAARAIIVSAGTVNSPKLLMLSGIGDPHELAQHGIGTNLALPAVGRNLREHALIHLNYRARIPTHNLTEGWPQKWRIALEYLRYREGPVAAAYEAAAFLKTLSSLDVPDVQIFFAPIGWGAVDGQARLARYPALKIVVLGSHSQSAGRIRLASADPDAPPVIEPRLFENESDIDVLVRGVDVVREILRHEPIASLIEDEVSPGARITAASGLREHVRQSAEPACHPFGTCRMGCDADAVVGPDLRVRGTENLWVADASILPDGISANLNAVCMMIGAKLGRTLASSSKP